MALLTQPVYTEVDERLRQSANLCPRATLVQRSRGVHTGPTLNVNVFNGEHFSYIRNVSRFCRLFKCFLCDKLFNHHNDYQRHTTKCNVGVKEIFPGGGFGKRVSLFEELADVCGIFIPKEKQAYRYMGTYDFEARFREIPDDDWDGTVTANSKNQTIDREHVDDMELRKTVYHEDLLPASVAVHSNVPGYHVSANVIINADIDSLLNEMYTYMEMMAEMAFRMYRNDPDFGVAIDACKVIKANADRVQRQIADVTRTIRETEKTPEMVAVLEELQFQQQLLRRKAVVANRFLKWCQQLPFFGFNSGRFDINLIRSWFFPALIRRGKRPSVIKKLSAYMLVETDHVRLLDMRMYLAPDTNYSAFLRSQQIAEQKSM